MANSTKARCVETSSTLSVAKVTSYVTKQARLPWPLPTDGSNVRVRQRLTQDSFSISSIIYSYRDLQFLWLRYTDSHSLPYLLIRQITYLFRYKYLTVHV
jgi:hypothetical protein